MKLKRKVLYPSSFLKSVPVPESWDRRPLPNLIHNSPNSENELTCLENWYGWLKSGQKNDLKKKLRSLTYRDFWSAYAELMVSRVAYGLGATSVKHSPLIWDKRPDLMVSFAGRDKQIWEVAALFQAQSKEMHARGLYELAGWINREISPNGGWKIWLDGSEVKPGGIPYKKIKAQILDWWKNLDCGGRKNLKFSRPEMNCELCLTAIKIIESENSSSIIDGIFSGGGSSSATIRLKEVLRKKIKKYRDVKKSNHPLVVFLFEGDREEISPFALEGALWGQQTVSFSGTIPGNSSWGVQDGGLFLPGPNGRDQNTRLSAVVYCRRICKDNDVSATLNVYHNPMAMHPFKLDFSGGAAQCKAIIKETEIEISWDYQRDTRMLRLA